MGSVAKNVFSTSVVLRRLHLDQSVEENKRLIFEKLFRSEDLKQSNSKEKNKRERERQRQRETETEVLLPS